MHGLAIGLFLVVPIFMASAPNPAAAAELGAHAAAIDQHRLALGTPERGRRVERFLAELAERDASAAAPGRHLVTTLADSGPGSLRDAIDAANALPGMDLIEFDPALSGTLSLTSDPLWIKDSVVLFGPGTDRLTLSGNNQRRLISIFNAMQTVDVLLVGLTLSDGASEFGAAIDSQSANLSLSDCVISGNNTRNSVADETGGGIYSVDGSLRIEHSVVRGNSAGDKGGGIAVFGSLVSIEDSLIADNLAAEGGGLYVDTRAVFAMRRTLVTDNTAGERAAGVYLAATNIDGGLIENSTLSSNRIVPASGPGAGLYARGRVALIQSTVAQNRVFGPNVPADIAAGVHFDDANGTLSLGSSLIADNAVISTPADLGRSAGTIDAMFSLVRTPLAQAVNGRDVENLYGVDPLLGALADNGGISATHAIATDSPARDKGVLFYYIGTDQRGIGYPRQIDASADIGAYEYGADALFSNGFDN